MNASFKTLLALLAALILIFAAGCSDGSDVSSYADDSTSTEGGGSDDSGNTDADADGNDEEDDLPNVVWNQADEDDVWWVNSAEGLLAWALASQKNFALSCNLGADIDLANEWIWIPIGDSSNHYTGAFNGRGYTITGVNINSSSTNYIGFFGYVGEGGTVQNLNLADVEITGRQYTGGIAGQNYGTIDGCSSSGSVTGTSFVGGIAGQNNGTISGCSSSGSVAGVSNVGGVLGYNNALYYSDAAVTACYSIAKVTSSGSGSGGIAGQNTNKAAIIGCYYNGGTVSVGNVTHGGCIAGYNTTACIITACYWSGTVVSSSASSERGIGKENNSGGSNTADTTQVDGSATTWDVAMYAMNSALSDAGVNWQYTATGATGDVPLVLEKNTD